MPCASTAFAAKTLPFTAFRYRTTENCGTTEGIWLQCGSTQCNAPAPPPPPTGSGDSCPGGYGSAGRRACDAVRHCLSLCFHCLSTKTLPLSMCVSNAFLTKTLPFAFVCSTAFMAKTRPFALCLLPSWLRHCLCLVRSTASVAKTAPLSCGLPGGRLHVERQHDGRPRHVHGPPEWRRRRDYYRPAASGQVRHSLCLVFPLPSRAKTLPFSLCFHCLRGYDTAFALRPSAARPACTPPSAAARAPVSSVQHQRDDV